MYDRIAKEAHVALRKLSQELIISALIHLVAAIFLLGILVCSLLALNGVSLVESVLHFIDVAAGPVGLVKTHLILAIGFAIYLCFVSYQNWAGTNAPHIGIRLFFKTLESARYWISQLLGRTRVVQSPNLTSRWFAYPERIANQGTRYLPGDSPQLE